MKIVSWNMQHKQESWRRLLDMDIDLALLQETCLPPADVADRIEIDPVRLAGHGGRVSWPTAIAKVSDRIRVEWLEAQPVGLSVLGDIAMRVSSPGTLTVGRVTPPSGQPFIAASIYGEWENLFSPMDGKLIYADASAHRLVSDLAVFVGRQRGHRILAAGDLNICRGHGENGNEYWAARYATVFARMEAMGIPCIGPEFPNGRQADPWPDELPHDSRNVPTFHSNRQGPETALRQLDYVFASTEFAKCLYVRALNEPEDWGPSDHCRISIELAAPA